MDIKNPMVSIKDLTNASFLLSYYVYKHKLGDFIKHSKIGNLLAIGDNNLNIILIQSSNWNIIAGIINFQ